MEMFELAGHCQASNISHVTATRALVELSSNHNATRGRMHEHYLAELPPLENWYLGLPCLAVSGGDEIESGLWTELKAFTTGDNVAQGQ